MRAISAKRVVGRATGRDFRLWSVLGVAAGIAALGYVVTLMPAQKDVQPKSPLLGQVTAGFDELAVASPGAQEESASETTATTRQDAVAKAHLASARKMIEAGQADKAIELLNEVRSEVQQLPESYLVMGEALLKKKDFMTARDFFNTAINRDRRLADAYFGFAVAAEGLGDLQQALGGMRSYLHLQANPDPYRLKVAQARSAIWEWESKLGRGEWGGSRGIPPGFTEAELKRDGRGVGTKMPIPGTEDATGISRYEIKHSDKMKLFNK